MENVLAVVPIITNHRPDKYTCYCHECTMQRIEEREQMRLEAEQRVEELIEEHPVIECIPQIGITFMVLCLLIGLCNSIAKTAK